MAPGISIAPSDGVMVAAPTWQRIDTLYAIHAWTIDRGRPNEMSRTDTGTARIELVDTIGDFDPTNPASPFWGLITTDVPMGPLVQAEISLQNPVSSAWSTLFRGFISSITWQPYQTKAFANVTLDLVDALALLAAAEMPPDFGDDFIDGNIVFYADTALTAVQTRINKLLDGIGWASSLRSIFTGNVALQKSVYPPRATVLQAMQDAADGEFPDIANIYIGGPRNPGEVVFHGRFARFHPDDTTYGLQRWWAGDDTGVNLGGAGTFVKISPPLTASLDDTLLYTSALSAPQNIADGDIPGQYVEDATAVAAKSLRTWSAENLPTLGGALGRTGLQETKLYADYIRDNYPTPRVRVGQLTVKSRRPESVNGPATWNLLCGVDISDVVHLKTVHVGGGGFDNDFYVEGVHYTGRPGPGNFPIVELTLDVSPRGYYDSNPFE